ncbi:MAG: CoB--CoM heterodisulfide reductase iron-sulfur subunit A family protein [Deltaproteobacteria bacterium]|nr:CoB--CoM heterodisulfide reductase iron-sulfur subunit A family protein [Deltaproteobacteria bacterium]MBW2102353.1 CoB--CoM heterodisulfide reductase iron-sulfur subunit A family protein [Deltaproteobacteria bacterium]MBW2348756.1 CoB--CoM heterodisulfide reductase iron-sulfur subunit A family protein [Deltaproteobacteria bacterium]
MADVQTTNQSILVVGGGMSGITAALEATEAGYDVVLVEKNPYLGGRVAQIYHYFPKLCPPNCGLEINFKRMRVNPRLRFFTMSEVSGIKGSAGDYDVTIKTMPRYVNENCTCCGKCAEVVETEIDNPFNYGMDKIKAAYLPHPFAFPMRYVLDPSIVGTEEGKKALEACEYGAIDLEMTETSFDLKVGAIVWAAGWQPYDASKVEYYGFGEYPNVITNVMMERLADPNGPTGGKIVRPSDGKEAKKVAFIQCAGSRDENHLPYCSGICCLASMKQATYLREQYPDGEATIFFIDIRALDRLEDFYIKVQEDEKIQFVKSKIAFISEDEESGDLLLEGENTRTGKQIRETFDMVVLATGMVPNGIALEEPPDVSFDDYGFLTLDPEKPGIFGAGCVRRPTDVASSVQDATASALKAIQTIARR